MKRTLAMLLALALLLLCACSAAPEPTQPAAEPPVETAETLPDHAAQDDAASEPAQPLFWQVSGNGYSGSFYLLGSIHVSDGLTYPQELLDAYAACDTLAVESDVLALEADLSAQVEMMRCLVYTDGTTIDAHLDAQTYADAKQVLTDLGGYQTMLDHYMPIFWYLAGQEIWRWRRRAFRRTAAWTAISCSGEGRRHRNFGGRAIHGRLPRARRAVRGDAGLRSAAGHPSGGPCRHGGGRRGAAGCMVQRRRGRDHRSAGG